MFVANCFSSNEKGHLTISGCDVMDLKEEYGTPLYVISEDCVRENCRKYTGSVKDYYNGKGMVVYAGKTLMCKEMCRIMKEENMGLDVVSGGELFTALSVDFPAERICFHGNNKTDDEIRLALQSGVGRIIVDNPDELKKLEKITAETGKTANILLRIKPGIDAHTHNFIRTGQIDSKFGFALETGEAYEAVKSAIGIKNIRLAGIHCHIGSQIFDVDPFKLAAEVMLQFMGKVKKELGYEMTDLNLGGGFGIKYLEDDDAKAYDLYMESVSKTVHEVCGKCGIEIPFIMIEPGRSVAGPAGITLYTVGGVKNIPNVRTYVSVDGGMGDNPRYALYQASYHLAIANRINEEPDTLVTVAGKCCESGDLIQENIKLNNPQVGDTLAVFCTGAYNYSMASNYNRIPRPAMVMVSGGKSRVIIKRESYEDLIRNDI